MTALCAWCADPFVPTRIGHKHCSQKCRKAANREAKAKLQAKSAPPKPITAVNCCRVCDGRGFVLVNGLCSGCLDLEPLRRQMAEAGIDDAFSHAFDSWDRNMREAQRAQASSEWLVAA